MEVPSLTLNESWKILGKDASIILQKLKEIPDPGQRVIAAEKALEKAKVIGKKLQAKYHPDINKSPGSHEFFIKIGQAVRSLEIHTEMMREKFNVIELQPKKDRIIL